MLPLHRSPHLTAIRYGIASIWLFHGLFAKLLGLIPRQQAIVGRVLGTDHSRSATAVIGVVEILMAFWIISGKWPRWCAAAVTLMLAGMNTFELTFARDLLLAPAWMVGANTLLAGMVWYVALSDRDDGRNSPEGPTAEAP